MHLQLPPSPSPGLYSVIFSPQGSHGSRPRVVITDLASFVFRAQKLWHTTNPKLSQRMQGDPLLVFILFEFTVPYYILFSVSDLQRKYPVIILLTNINKT